MRALLDDAAMIDHQNTIAVLHGGEPVRNHDAGAIAHQSAKRLLNESFAFGIER